MNKLNQKELLERGLISDPTDDIGDMDGPYKYTKDEVDKRVKNTTWNGNYRIGYLNDEGAFVPKYVGRGVVNDRLKKHLDEGCKDTHFKFMYEADEIKSYEIESAGYHRFQGQIRNEIHPRSQMVWMNCFALIAANDVGASVSTTVSPWNNSSDCRISTIEYISTN